MYTNSVNLETYFTVVIRAELTRFFFGGGGTKRKARNSIRHSIEDLKSTNRIQCMLQFRGETVHKSHGSVRYVTIR